jgi:outer membrane protein OmpA-like peptidoglycan-associated protein
MGNKSGRYMFARLEQGEQTAYLMLAAGDSYTDVHLVEMKKMQTDNASVNPGALLDGLDKQGFVVLEGIYFDTDKTTLKPTSRPALEQAARLMQAHPDLKLYVVGHTDMQGSLEHNMKLSQGRAEAVVNTLVKDHGIAAARLQGRGIGPLAPVAANTLDDGRARNRRNEFRTRLRGHPSAPFQAIQSRRACGSANGYRPGAETDGYCLHRQINALAFLHRGIH